MSAIETLRAAYISGQADVLAPSAIVAGVIELADRIGTLEARVFPPPPPSTDAAVIAAEPIQTDAPTLTGTFEAPAPTPAPAAE